MAIVLEESGLQVLREAPLEVWFRGRSIGTFYADLIVNGTVLIEIKASATIEGYAVAQTLNYLKVAGGGVGLFSTLDASQSSRGWSWASRRTVSRY